MTDENAKADIIAFRALRFFDRAIAQFYRKRHRAHGNRIGLVGASAPRGCDKPFGKIHERGLIEKRCHCGWQSVYGPGLGNTSEPGLTATEGRK
jgi:hypothetical protein